MRFPMKRSYYEDIRIFRYRSTFFWYLALMIGLLILPKFIGAYLLSQLNFIAIFAIAVVGLMLLVGYTGQISLGHAAFFQYSHRCTPREGRFVEFTCRGKFGVNV